MGTDESSSKVSSPVIVALDALHPFEAVALARILEGLVWGFKVNDLLLRQGTEVVGTLREYGQIFCDPKLHDIPNTVANQVQVLCEAGVDLVTLHGAGGEEMMRMAMEARFGETRILAVTVLTSMDEEATQSMYGRGVQAQVRHVAGLAKTCGMDGVICSPVDLPLLNEVDPDHALMRVTPGVRPTWYVQPDDQERVLNPAEAMEAGADLLVVGRPITHARDPATAISRILTELGIPV